MSTDRISLIILYAYVWDKQNIYFSDECPLCSAHKHINITWLRRLMKFGD